MIVHKPQKMDLLSPRRVRIWAVLALTCVLLLFFVRQREVSAEWSSRRHRSSSSSVATSDDAEINSTSLDAADSSKFAYLQYVTNSHYLCNSVMLFEQLQQYGSKADRVMMYPAGMFELAAAEAGEETGGRKGHDVELLIRARDEFGVRLVPVSIHHKDTADSTWAESFTKLLAFNQTQYDRVLSLDSDAVLLDSLDELFTLPASPVAMPRAYWLYPGEKKLASHILLVEPSAAEFQRVLDAMSQGGEEEYDMEILNTLYQDSALVIPHRRYALLTQVFRWEDGEHAKYLGSDREEWDPVAVFNEAKYLHFSDWPLPKPWIEAEEDLRLRVEPRCRVKEGVETCFEKEIWNGIYQDFRARRQRVCGHAIDPLETPLGGVVSY
ncbi:family 8 putative glycosyltransferase [Triangularia verruculosa]|uniref:Family 8 putative glycosyltransferase n=1 Tax=Triangularia verruculosa TaxID=2587418 RepID=A0AAN6XRW0_9PEZI|nr:family 8 putative glycosyltransferase [Triangularia verruculosa]